MKVAIVGAGWAGCAAAVEAVRCGHAVTLFEASHAAGGRAKAALMHEGVRLDNGQHILIGAYTETLRMMALVGLDEHAVLARMPLSLRFADGQGLVLPALPAPLDALAGIARARGWTWRDKWSLLRAATGWQLSGFACAPERSVTDLCKALTPRIVSGLIEPLCVSALNTPAVRASGQVFLRVLRDALFSQSGGSNLLLPLVDLNALFPDAALRWLDAHGANVQMGHRVEALQRLGDGWLVDDDAFDRVVLACAPWDAARLVECSGAAADTWLAQAHALQFEAITTVYAHAPGARLTQPMLALRSAAGAPAQFVFDRGQLNGTPGVLAFVVSSSSGERLQLQYQVLAQAGKQLGLHDLSPIQTVTEKRATFACTPGLQRPGMRIGRGLLVCGDYVDGPYPATLEGAVRSAVAATAAL